ncbi:unnamed protein product [Hymenolepis diminuta]|uniref:Uncharacterized protein n=1 Tax=Hymenolepis diminuta TaxID=6216 RepID=A0A564YDF9_HYMDI|nr:unnamed protein product [Hymenolepis diminuta]
MKTSVRKSSSRIATNYCRILLENPNSVLFKPSPLCLPTMYTHPIPVFSPPLKILYNLPLPQSSPHSKTLSNLPLRRLACLSRTLCGRRNNFPSRL